MRAVNLLPRELDRDRKGLQLPVVVGCAGAVLAAAVLAGGYLSASSSVGSKNAKLAEVEAQIAAVPRPEAQPATVTGLPAERQARVAALATALAQRVAWDRVLREVSLVLPDDVWLQSLNATAPTPGGATTAPGTSVPNGFSIHGFTYSQTGVARLLSRLTVIPDLTSVTLQSSTTSKVADRPVVEFTIVGNVRLGGAAS